LFYSLRLHCLSWLTSESTLPSVQLPALILMRKSFCEKINWTIIDPIRTVSTIVQ
jgi:hypothetical protein